jgi:hypothetical protein
MGFAANRQIGDRVFETDIDLTQTLSSLQRNILLCWKLSNLSDSAP